MRYGVNADPLREGKLDLPELLEEPAGDDWEWARDFVAQREWREAVTYRETAPHEYVVRSWETEEQGNRVSHFSDVPGMPDRQASWRASIELCSDATPPGPAGSPASPGPREGLQWLWQWDQAPRKCATATL